jgi:hypothetical protein
LFVFSDGYRSCITYFGDNLLLAVGRQSSDFSFLNESGNFESLAGNFHTVKKNKFGDIDAAWASGAEGKVAKLTFN